jgi:hypothetical protein
MIRMIEAGADKEELARHADSLTKQASKQLAVLTYFRFLSDFICDINASFAHEFLK